MKESEIRPKEIFNKYLELSKKDAESFDISKFETLSCIACGSDSLTDKFSKNNFMFQECNVCGSLFCNPRPSQSTLDEFYRNSISAKYWFDEFLPKVEDARREKLFSKKAKDLHKIIQENDINVKTLCDVGAGSGVFLEELQKVMPDISYYAIEPGNVSSSIIAEKGFSVLQQSVEDSKEWSNKFDFVVSLEVLEHVASPQEFVSSVSNILRQEGTCLITTLGYEGFDIQVLGKRSNSISPPHHLNFLSIEGFNKLFKHAGFSEVTVMTPGILDVDIILNSNYCPDFMRVLHKRGQDACHSFQDLLMRYQLSSHVWVIAKK